MSPELTTPRDRPQWSEGYCSCPTCADRPRKVRYSHGGPTKGAKRRVLARGGCYICGGPAITVDHLHPASLGGSHKDSNLLPACVRCNSKKGNGTDPRYQALAAMWRGSFALAGRVSA